MGKMWQSFPKTVKLQSEDRLDEIIAGFVARLSREISVEEVILFGSYAHGKAKEHSDIDLLATDSHGHFTRATHSGKGRNFVCVSLWLKLICCREKFFYCRRNRQESFFAKRQPSRKAIQTLLQTH